jgi:hypothetical protein
MKLNNQSRKLEKHERTSKLLAKILELGTFFARGSECHTNGWVNQN